MRPHVLTNDTCDERGITLIEVMIALIVLSLGIMAVGGIFPTATRTELQTRMLSTASYYAQQRLEMLKSLNWDDPALSAGRHPAGSACDTLGVSGSWTRFYQVDLMAAPLDDLKRVSCTVSWTYKNTRSVIDTVYVRK